MIVGETYLSCEEDVLYTAVLDLRGNRAWPIEGGMRESGDGKLQPLRDLMHHDVVRDVRTGRVPRR